MSSSFAVVLSLLSIVACAAVVGAASPSASVFATLNSPLLRRLHEEQNVKQHQFAGTIATMSKVFVPEAARVATKHDSFSPLAYTYITVSQYSDQSCAKIISVVYLPLGACNPILALNSSGQLTCSGTGVAQTSIYSGLTCQGTAIVTPASTTCSASGTGGGSSMLGSCATGLPSLAGQRWVQGNAYSDSACATFVGSVYLYLPAVGSCQMQNSTYSLLLSQCSSSSITAAGYMSTTCTGTPILNQTAAIGVCTTNADGTSAKFVGINCSAAISRVAVAMFAIVVVALLAAIPALSFVL